MKPILLALLACGLLLGGCGLADQLNRPVANAEAQARVEQVEGLLHTLQGVVSALQNRLTEAQAYIAEQDAKLAQARELAEASKSDAALAIVAAIQRLRDQAAAGIPAIQSALEAAQAQVPQVTQALAEVKAQAATLPAGGTSPLWVVLGTLMLPLVIKGTQLATAGIPGVGPVVSGVAETAITGLWNTLATARQKAADAANEAKAKALPHQVQVTNALVVAAGDKAAPILKAAKESQIAAGVHATLDTLVAAVEAKAA